MNQTYVKLNNSLGNYGWTWRLPEIQQLLLKIANENYLPRFLEQPNTAKCSPQPVDISLYRRTRQHWIKSPQSAKVHITTREHQIQCPLFDPQSFAKYNYSIWRPISVKWAMSDLHRQLSSYFMVEYHESLIMFRRIWSPLHLNQQRLSHLWIVAYFALHQNTWTVAAWPWILCSAVRYLFVTQCCHPILAGRGRGISILNLRSTQFRRILCVFCRVFLLLK